MGSIEGKVSHSIGNNELAPPCRSRNFNFDILDTAPLRRVLAFEGKIPDFKNMDRSVESKIQKHAKHIFPVSGISKINLRFRRQIYEIRRIICRCILQTQTKSADGLRNSAVVQRSSADCSYLGAVTGLFEF